MTNGELDNKYNNLLNLCNALNEIPYVSDAIYWGGEHNDQYLNIQFRVKDIKSLMVVARSIDNRYSGPPRYEVRENWHVEVGCIDVLPGYNFNLRSFNKEEYAYEWSDKIAKNIEDILKRENVLEHFGVRAEETSKQIIEKEEQKKDKQEIKRERLFKEKNLRENNALSHLEVQ